MYLIVGGLATLVEWAIFYVAAERIDMHYMAATATAFVFSTFANWLFGRILLFKARENVLKEIGKIYLTSIAGFIMNMAIMYLAVDVLSQNEMLSKIAATGIVFIWNFLIRKLLIYRD